MSALKVGRNDPCPCGSGKKYKQCHMRVDQESKQNIPGVASMHAGQRGEANGDVSPSYSLGQELRHLQERLEEVAADEHVQADIERAAVTLEAHRAEFDALLEDQTALVRHAEGLFGEERFRPWRFTASDVGRAFSVVGYPQRVGAETEQNSEIMQAAMLHLAGQGDYRATTSRRLMRLLPEFVAQGRYPDAWLIQYAAFLMFERPTQSNVFLGIMFKYGLKDWGREVQREGETALREMGLDPNAMRTMDPEQALAHLQTQMADPERKARIERYYAEHPLLSQQNQAEIDHLGRQALSLWQRADAQSIQLAPEEVQPWLPMLLDRLEPLTKNIRQSAKDQTRAVSRLKERAGRAIWDVAAEMSTAVFTHERITRLARDLTAYRMSLLKSHEGEAATYANGAVLILEHQDTRSGDPLLVGICWLSLRNALIAASTNQQ